MGSCTCTCSRQLRAGGRARRTKPLLPAAGNVHRRLHGNVACCTPPPPTQHWVSGLRDEGEVLGRAPSSSVKLPAFSLAASLPARGVTDTLAPRTLRSCLWLRWDSNKVPPPPLAHARPCLSTGWALNRRFEEILGPLFLWSRMEDWVSVERLYRERGAHSCL